MLHAYPCQVGTAYIPPFALPVLPDLVSTAQTEAIENSAQSASYSASMLAIDSATTSFAFIVCQLFNESTNELGLRIYSVLHTVETCQALWVYLVYPMPYGVATPYRERKDTILRAPIRNRT